MGHFVHHPNLITEVQAGLEAFSNLDNNKKEWILLLSVPKTRRIRQEEMFI